MIPLLSVKEREIGSDCAESMPSKPRTHFGHISALAALQCLCLHTGVDIGGFSDTLLRKQ